MTVTVDPMISRHAATGDLTEIPEGISRTRRMTLRRLQLIELGKHPITSLPIHPLAPADASKRDRYPRPFTCGECVHRIRHHGYPKCDELTRHELELRSSRTDTYRWLPACIAYRPRGEPAG